MDENTNRAEKSLWEDYLFLTQEMGKCLSCDDFSLFEELLAQRQRLQQMIEECHQQKTKDSGFVSEQDRGELLSLVQTANNEVSAALRVYHNARRSQSNAAMAYEGLDNPLLGARMDKQR